MSNEVFNTRDCSLLVFSIAKIVFFAQFHKRFSEGDDIEAHPHLLWCTLAYLNSYLDNYISTVLIIRIPFHIL